MKREIFSALQSARDAKRPVVVATALRDGRQSLIDGDKATGDLPLSETLRTAVRRALRDDKSHTIETGEAGSVFSRSLSSAIDCRDAWMEVSRRKVGAQRATYVRTAAVRHSKRGAPP